MSGASGGVAGVSTGRGVRDCEARLVSELRAELEKGDPALLARPVRVLVPSRALRQHLCSALTRASARAALGVRIETFASVAAQILDRAHATAQSAGVLFSLLVGQHVQSHGDLSSELGELRGGAELAAATISDLLDAGLDVESAVPLALLLELNDVPDVERTRCASLVDVALRVSARLHDLGRERGTDSLRRAARWLRERPDLLPCRRVIVYGAADATGALCELLDALRETHGAELWLDLPPGRDGASDAWSYAAPLAQRWTSRELAAPPSSDASVAPALLCAAGIEGETRAVADEIRAALDAGARPEAIAVVVRNLDPYLISLRRHFMRLGIPFSGGRPGPPTPRAWRLTAIAELIRDAEHTPVERWLDALGSAPELSSRTNRLLIADLRVGLHSLGIGRLRELAALDVRQRLSRDHLPLPTVTGIQSGDDDSHRVAYRKLPRRVLEAAQRRAQALLARFERWTRHAVAEDQLRELHELLHDDLGWSETLASYAPLRDAMEQLRLELPNALELDRRELAAVFAKALEPRLRLPLGGAGAGVAVLDAMEARGLSFEHLYLIGLVRELFPRSVHEDPLLSDSLRKLLREALPELPLKRRGHLEEEYLYAQLRSSAQRTTLCWHSQSDDSEPRSPSVFIDRLRLCHPEISVTTRLRSDRSLARSAHEHAILAGLDGTRAAFEAALRLAIEEVTVESPGALPLFSASATTQARLAVLREWDAAPWEAPALGPYFGFVSTSDAKGDPRATPPPITTLENLARCPWQSFLRRLLKLEATPDSLDGLPALDKRLIGEATHEALRRIILGADESSRPVTLEESLRTGGYDVPWPNESELERIREDAAREALLECGVALPGLAHALAEKMSEHLDAAHTLIWPRSGAPLRALGAELKGELTVAGARTLTFRVDLADLHDGAVRLTDFKTGKVFSTGKKEETRRAELLSRVTKGTNLQGAVYQIAARDACAAGGLHASGATALGGYAFLDPELSAEHALVYIEGSGTPIHDACESTLDVLLDAWHTGRFPPRLVEGRPAKENASCDNCEVAEVCLRHDSGARMRLAAALGGPADPLVKTVLSLGLESNAPEDDPS